MFGLTSLELRLAFYGVLLAGIAAYVLYERHEGYEACRAPQKAADKAQVEKDLADAKGTIHELREKLAAVPPAPPPPVLRLCPQPRSLRAGEPAGGTQPAVASGTGEGPLGVPAGDLGLDIGPQLQASKRAADVLAIYADETRDWAVKQATK